MRRTCNTSVSFDNCSKMTKKYWNPVVVMVKDYRRFRAIHYSGIVVTNRRSSGNVAIVISLNGPLLCPFKKMMMGLKYVLIIFGR